MPRTTEADVATLLEVDPDLDLEVHIVSANELVTELCTNSGYTDTRLELIERWLAAHFYSISDRSSQTKFEGAGTVQASYDSKVDLGFRVTTYGQQALRLDTAGNLAALDNSMDDVKKPLPAGKTQVGMQWLGKKC